MAPNDFRLVSGAGGRVLAAIGLALTLMVWQVHEARSDPEGYWLYARDPARWDGAPVVISIYQVMTILGPDRLIVGRGQTRAPVEVATAERVLGEEITVLGHFRAADAMVVAERVETHPGRPYKMLSGYAAILLTLLLLPVWLRPSRAGLVLRG